MAKQEPTSSTLTRVVAFYSYKGGVGRTLALANCARALVAKGKKVVLMDFDLEAPGLQHFDALLPREEKPNQQAGFVEYLKTCLDEGPPENLQDYIYQCKGKKSDQGRAWLMSAGIHREPGYLDFLNKMNWSDFYTQQEGYKILENLRGHIIADYQPDYIFIDARTGQSEIGGIATHQLADIVMLVFNLNGQNLQGAKQVFDSIIKAPLSPKIILIASPVPVVPVEKGTPFAKKMSRINKDFKGAYNSSKPLIVPYHPLLAFDDRLLVDEGDLFSSDAPYQQIVTLLQKVAEVDADYYLQQMVKPLQQGDWQQVKKIAHTGLSENSKNINLLNNLANAYYFLNELESAVSTFDLLISYYTDTQVLDFQEQVANALFNKGVVLKQLDRAEDAIAAYDELIQRFADSDHLVLQEQVANALLNKGLTLEQLDRAEDAIAAYDDLIQRFADSDHLVLQEHVAKALFNKGVTLGQLEREEDEIATYDELIRRYADSEHLVLQEPVVNALNSKGFRLLIQAKQPTSNEQRIALLNTALALFEQALLRVKADNKAMIVGNQAYTLFLLKHKSESEDKLNEALRLGGESLYQATLADTKISPVSEDADFRQLLDRLWDKLKPTH